MSDTSVNNKRIAKNTLFLYIRMLLMMLVTLYTSRIVLDKLGITDYGIYNVVGGIVAMLGFLTNSMANAVQRFLSFEIGRGDKQQVNRVFNVSLLAHIVIAIVIFIVMEVVGVWYLNTQMNIPAERLSAANWVLQCSVFTTLFTVVQVPYNALIIAKEQMGIYAYISIMEVTLKLLIVYLLSLFAFDKLKLYSVLVMIVTVGILMVYRVYCMRKYEETKFRIVKNRAKLKEIIQFAGWNMLGELAWVFTGQGVNIILNLFFGPAVNAARGLAEQVNGAVSRFVNNFQVALNPQLIKNYASGQVEEMKILLFRGIRFSFYLLLIITLPLILNMDMILRIWLKDVPHYTTEFCQLVLICNLVSTLSNLLAQVPRAYGKIRNYQIVVSICLFCNFPLSYLVLNLGFSPLITMVVNICINGLLLPVRLRLIKNMISMSMMDYLKKVMLPVVKVSLLSIVVPCTVAFYFEDGWVKLVVLCLLSVVWSTTTVLTIGMNVNERAYTVSSVKKIINRISIKR